MVVHVRHLPHHAKKRGNFTMSSGFRGVLALKLTLIIPRQCKTTMTTRTTSSRPPPETTRAPQDPTKETRNCFPPGTGAFSGARVYASPPSLAGSSSTLRTGSPPNTAAIQGFREPNCNTPRSKIPSSPKHTKTWGRDLQHLL